jgi:exopolysaccharide biosynthesis polyprenyl glycosylphosphotransferase
MTPAGIRQDTADLPLRDGVHRRRGRITALRVARALPQGGELMVAHRRDRVYRRVLAVADIVAATLAIMLTVSVLGSDQVRPAALLWIPIVVITSKLMGLYDRDELLLRKTTLDESPVLFQLATLYTLVTVLLQSVLIDGELSSIQIAALWGSFLSLTLMARSIARETARRVVPAERCLLVGGGPGADHVACKLEQGDVGKTELVGRLPLEHDGEHLDMRSLTQIEEAIQAHDVHRIVLAPRMADTDAMLDVIRLVKSLGVKVSILPRMFEVIGSSVEFDDLRGVTVLGVRRFGLTKSSSAVKRTFDVLGAGAGVLAVAPIFLGAALAIRLESPGQILFRQMRVGRDGKRFQMLKFRTMVDGADAMKAELQDRNESEGLFKIADDPRITRVGRLLRRTALDELPQLINVLRGDMSLVGPRPLVPDEDHKIEGFHRRRLHLTPGMTGHWQILGSAKIPLHDMVKIDYLYVANWSFWSDVKILLRTVPYMLRRDGM